jgi:hypothetical protein
MSKVYLLFGHQEWLLKVTLKSYALIADELLEALIALLQSKISEHTSLTLEL